MWEQGLSLTTNSFKMTTQGLIWPGSAGGGPEGRGAGTALDPQHPQQKQRCSRQRQQTTPTTA